MPKSKKIDGSPGNQELESKKKPWEPIRLNLAGVKSAGFLEGHPSLHLEPVPLLEVPEGEKSQQRKIRLKREVFLATYRRLGTVTAAAQHVGMAKDTHEKWKQNDPDYAAAYEKVKVEAIEMLETEARRRALYGVEDLVLVNGRPVILVDPATGQERLLTKRIYSDTLLMFVLKANKPRKYRHMESKKKGVETPSPDQKPGAEGDLPVSEDVDWSVLEPTEVEMVRSLLIKAAKKKPELHQH